MSGVDPNRAGVLVVGGGSSLPPASGANEIPVSSGAGTTYVATSAAGVRAALSTGSSTAGLLSALPGSASEGDSYYCTDTGDRFVWLNGAWCYVNGSAYQTLATAAGSSPTLHVRADLGVTSSSGVVSAWANQGSVAVNGSQGTAGYRPTIVSGLAPNGKPGIVFDGTDDSIDFAYDAAWAPAAMTVCVVADVRGSGTQIIVGVPYSDTANTSPFGVWYFSNTSGTTLGLRIGASTSSAMTIARPGGGTIFAGPRVYCYSNVTGASNRIFRVGGRQLASPDTGATPANTNSSKLRIGANGANGEAADMVLYEVALWSSVLSVAQKAAVEAQMSQRWGVPLTW